MAIVGLDGGKRRIYFTYAHGAKKQRPAESVPIDSLAVPLPGAGQESDRLDIGADAGVFFVQFATSGFDLNDIRADIWEC